MAIELQSAEAQFQVYLSVSQEIQKILGSRTVDLILSTEDHKVFHKFQYLKNEKRVSQEDCAADYLLKLNSTENIILSLKDANKIHGHLVIGLNSADELNDIQLSYLQNMTLHLVPTLNRILLLKEKNKLESVLNQNRRLESLGLLAGGIAHDFNNLLTAILGNVTLARRSHEAQDTELFSRHLSQAEVAIQRSADLTKQILAYAGKGQFDIRNIQTSEMVEEIVGFLKPSVSKKIEFNLKLNHQIPVVRADVTQIRQTILNFLTNSVDAIGDQKGSIDIETGVENLTKEKMKASILSAPRFPGDYVYIQFSDSGCGMSVQTLERIFDPFFSTKVNGRGLGLSAILGIIRSHGGLIFVNSVETKGTTFKVYLPPAIPKNV